MALKDKYCADSDKSKPENTGKKPISDDAFALAETIEDKLEHIRLSFMK